MRDRTYSSEGVILSRKNYGEADRILVVFSKHYGKIRLIAKGVRKTTSRKRGALELFNYIKFFAVNGKNMDLITEVEVKNGFSWRKDLTKVAVAYHLAEVVGRLTPEHQEHREVFDLLIESYGHLTSVGYWQLFGFIQAFKVRTLEELGFLEREKPIPKNLDLDNLVNGLGPFSKGYFL